MKTSKAVGSIFVFCGLLQAANIIFQQFVDVTTWQQDKEEKEQEEAGIDRHGNDNVVIDGVYPEEVQAMIIKGPTSLVESASGARRQNAPNDTYKQQEVTSSETKWHHGIQRMLGVDTPL